MTLQGIIRFGKKYLFALTHCFYAFTVGLASPKHRQLVSDISRSLGYEPGRVAPIIPRIALSDVLEEDLPVQILEPFERNGNVSLLELAVIINLMKQCKANTVFEIGTFDGRTTLNLSFNSAEGARIHTLDLPKERATGTRFCLEKDEIVFTEKPVPGGRFRGTPWAHKIEQLYGDSASFDFAPYYAHIDFVFIDGSHAYDYVINDSMEALKLLRKEGGVIVWHDYGGWEGVTRGLNELYRKMSELGNLHFVEATSLAYFVRARARVGQP